MNDDPGLDMAALRAVSAARGRTSPGALEILQRRIADHLETHDGYLAFSGGKDSLVVLDLARRVEPDVPVVFFDSGLEYPETYRYVHDLAQAWDLDLHVLAADPPLLDVLVASGQWDHGADPEALAVDLQRILIAEPATIAHGLFGPGELWGVRADESRSRRMLYTQTAHEGAAGVAGPRRDGVVARADGTTVFGPIWDWSTEQVWGHIARQHLPVNPVYEILTQIGVPESERRISHLISGDHVHRGRLTWLRRGWPELFEQLADALPRIRHLT